MNKLSTERRGQIVGLLVEGMSMRAISRTTGVARNTIDKLLNELGDACAEFMDAEMVNLTPRFIEADEIWSFVGSKQKNVPEGKEDTYGDIWTWTAIDAETKLIPTWLVGDRTSEDCYYFLNDLKLRCKPGHRFQLTTDGFGAYPGVVDALWREGIDYAVIIKDYKGQDSDHRYSPATCSILEVKALNGFPNGDHISTSYVERQNLTMRMGMRRFTRLTNGFSKKAENHASAVALHFMHYNFGRTHQSLTIKVDGKPSIKRTPAMAAGIAHRVWSLTDIAGLLD